MSDIQVLHCAETIKGGIATYLRELLPLQCMSFGAGAVAVVIPISQVAELPVPDGVVLLSYPDNGGRLGNAVALARTMVSLCRRHQPVVVHVHSTFAGATVRPALALFAHCSRVVYCPHGWAWDRPMLPLTRIATKYVERFLTCLSNSVVCISEHERRTALSSGLPATRLHLVLNGVAEQSPAPSGESPVWPEGVLRLLFVGRFDRQKGVDLLCDALERLGSKASAVFAGGTVLADGCELKLPANAVSIGWVTPQQLETLFAAADILVIPSRWEGFGLIAAEAMRAGLPVIATRVGGLPEVVADGETGLLVEPNSADAIARAVASLDRITLLRMGNAGRQRFLKLFTMNRVHRELCVLYDMKPAKGGMRIV